MTQQYFFLDCNIRFFSIKRKTKFLALQKSFPKMFEVLFILLGKDCNVIQVDNYKFILLSHECYIHRPVKHSPNIHQDKRHSTIHKSPPRCHRRIFFLPHGKNSGYTQKNPSIIEIHCSPTTLCKTWSIFRKG